MTEQIFLDMLRETIFLILLLSAPVLVVALVVGLIISLFQAVTQIQEATLTFVPKILASLFILVLSAPWMLSIFISHTRELFKSLVSLA